METKDIYIIRNTVNTKVYIGQAKDSKDRFTKHLLEAKCKNSNAYSYPLSKAIRKYGKQNFYFEVLESQIENYNEREIYFIDLLDCLAPKGYNISAGGEGLGTGFDNPNHKLSKKQVFLIKDKIKNSKMSLEKIGKLFNCSEDVISRINIGKIYEDKLNEIYPLRKTRLEKEKVKQIMYSLQYELDKTYTDISKEYNIERSFLMDINFGRAHHINAKKYPLRSGKTTSFGTNNAEVISDIKKDLKNSNISQNEIARKYNVSTGYISNINLGLYYRDDNTKYPIRVNYNSVGSRKCYSPNEIMSIEKDIIENKISLRNIAKKYECDYSTIVNINNGAIIKYRRDESIYPLRKK